ncbi:uncharacterized protein BJ171DRAFT_272433 [Polychytrium aggregatum]|uniref:uncharacterized protein n=1 Tax=Polychytrium aggregatum TaxID=110093 RepID=UPI0022FF04F8|nr:uncharacterized protein BJ171DRAFT_272433 [Polychytrium aggregatum]KAI9193299.1 hypothetical protein BJ171DRAFT_272433 [Polychytrium aggregatum]
MKQVFSALDVAASVADLKLKLIGFRLQNVYDVNQKLYLFKFAKPDHKELLLIESGIRIHTTQFSREKSSAPSSFVMKLRKHLRTRRLSDVSQLGFDRIVDMQFGDGEFAYHLIVELYASGNILLTDHEYRIMTLLRVVELDGTAIPGNRADDARFAVGEVYPNVSRPFEPMTELKLRLALETAEANENAAAQLDQPEDAPSQSVEKQDKQEKGKKKGGKQPPQQTSAKHQTKKRPQILTLKRFLREHFLQIYGPALVEHALAESGLDPNLAVLKDLDTASGSVQLDSLLAALVKADDVVRSCKNSPQKGWIISKSHAKDESRDDAGEFVTYEEFHPVLFSQFKNSPHKEFQGFDHAVDEFFSKLEAQKLELRARQAEQAAAKKLASVKASHENQVRGFEAARQNNEKTALAVELNLEKVDALVNTLRGFLASGMDWVDLAELIKEEQKRQNELALMVLQLKLDVGMVTIGLPNPDLADTSSDESGSSSDDLDSDDDDYELQLAAKKKAYEQKLALVKKRRDESLIKLDVDIYASAYANASRYYEAKKLAIVKHTKTLQVAEKAFKSAERKIAMDLKSTQQIVPSISKIRKPLWFEKFLWFVSSENYLVVGGRDATQNEMLVKRYLRKGDVYIHADLHGAASVIVKNTGAGPDATNAAGNDDCPIPPTTLLQAGTMSVCQSKAWDAKIVTSAWWVYDHQVSKTAPTGEYLTTGSFMIRGKKNWLPPIQLVYGFGILFKVDESSVGRHYWERRPWGRGQDPGNAPSAKSLDGGELPSATDVSLGQEEDRDEDVDEQSVMIGGGHAVDQDAPNDDAGDLADETEDPQDETTELEAAQANDTLGQGQHTAPDADDEASSATGTFPVGLDKYNLAALGESASDDASTQQSATQSKRYLSAKERRNAKKKQAQGIDATDPEDVADATSARVQSKARQEARATPFESKGTSPASKTPVRGKKGKAKKIKDKYRDQSDDERELMMKLLGSKGKAGTVEAKGSQIAKAQTASKEGARKQEHDQTEQSAASSLNKASTASPDGDADAEDENGNEIEIEIENEKDNETDEERNSADGTNADGTTADRDDIDEVRRLLEEENVALLDDDQASNMTFLDSLTGQPHPDDNLLYAIPMCAPWAALQKFKYKVKLLPGSLKKGKAAKAAITCFIAAANEEAKGRDDAVTAALSREKEWIKAIPETELMAQILGKVKVMSTGAADNKKQAKGKRK